MGPAQTCLASVEMNVMGMVLCGVKDKELVGEEEPEAGRRGRIRSTKYDRVRIPPEGKVEIIEGWYAPLNEHGFTSHMLKEME